MRFLCVILAIATAWLPAVALAIPSADDVVLGFGASYSAPDGATSIHRGIDLRLPAGADVQAPCAGEVSFVGTVPGLAGGTVLAVSITTAHGRVTLMPLASARVKKGESVAAGTSVGMLARDGDPSSAGSHLHLGLRQGDLYRDPSVLLATTAASGVTEPSPVGVPATTAAAPAPGAVPVAVPGAVGAGTSPVPVGAGTALSGASAPSGSAASAPVVLAPVTAAPETVGEPAQVAPSAGAALRSGLSPSGGLTADQAVPVQVGARTSDSSAKQSFEPSGGLESAAQRLVAMARGAAAEPLGLAAVVVAIIVSILVLTRVAIERRLVRGTAVSHRLGTLLQHMRAGDTLRGFNSCSGHDAFTVPGPPAQRR